MTVKKKLEFSPVSFHFREQNIGTSQKELLSDGYQYSALHFVRLDQDLGVSDTSSLSSEHGRDSETFRPRFTGTAAADQ